MATETMPLSPPAGPYYWLPSGKALLGAKTHVVICANSRGEITARDGAGVLRLITADHPAALLLAAAPDLLAALKELYSMRRTLAEREKLSAAFASTEAIVYTKALAALKAADPAYFNIAKPEGATRG